MCVQAESIIERAALVEQIGGLESDLLAETAAKEEAQVSIQGLEGLVANLLNKQVGLLPIPSPSPPQVGRSGG